MNRQMYLVDEDVHNFRAWLETKLDSGFEHHYYLLKARCEWNCESIYQAYENYWWPYSYYCPLLQEKVTGSNLSQSLEHLNEIARLFRHAVNNQDSESARLAALATLTWGGVINKNGSRINAMGSEICEYFIRAKEHLNLSHVNLENHEGIHMNAGFTKLYSLLVDDFIMYDGRVGAALGLLGRLYAEENGLEKIPEMIEFSFGNGKGSNKVTGNRRDPGKGKYKLPNFTGRVNRQINDNIKASWLLKSIADQTASRFASLPQESILNERLTAIQSALFMIGYNVQTKV